MNGNTEKPKPSECEACGATVDDPLASTQRLHEKNCIREYTKDGSCLCKVIPSSNKTLVLLNFHGRKLWLCEECHEKEKRVLQHSETALHEYNKNVPDRIERIVQARVKEACPVSKWQEIYATERTQWIVSNFENVDAMKSALADFITSMEVLEWEHRTRKRAAFDAAKELDARLSKEDREKLINDPNFKVPTNSEFKKIQKDRELDVFINEAGMKELTAKQRKAVQSLIDFGLSAQEIKDQLNLK